ncbi:outer membrane lipoprotein-sorting protein [Petrachloros mirabilis]
MVRRLLAEAMPRIVLLVGLVMVSSVVFDQGTGRPIAAAELSARDVAEKNFYVTKIPHLYNESTMTLINDKGQERVRKSRSVTVLQPNGIDSTIMIRFLYPGDIEGTGYLQIQHSDGEDDMWIYLPALKKVRRLVANNKRDSFVGSDFSYGDILLPVVDTYTHRLLPDEMLDGEECWVLESLPATEEIEKDYGYSKRIAWVRKSNFMEKKVVYYDTASRLLKTQIVPDVTEVEPVNHKWWALRREVVNHQTGHRTILTFEKLDPVKPVPEDYFTTRYLERER